jgi:hypothetical protein
MTSRLLLTLLALLTGLAAQTSPAEARPQAARAAEMSAVAGLSAEVREGKPAGIVEARASRESAIHDADRAVWTRNFAVQVSSVLTGIDRARE